VGDACGGSCQKQRSRVSGFQTPDVVWCRADSKSVAEGAWGWCCQRRPSWLDDAGQACRVTLAAWPERWEKADFLVANCAFTANSFPSVDAAALDRIKPGGRVISTG